MSQTATAPTVATAITWFEIPAADLDRAQNFYEAILETHLRREHFGGSDMAVFPAREGGVRGCLVETAHPSPHGTIVYLNVEGRMDRTLDLVGPAGGRVDLPKTELPGEIGCIAKIVDSEGNLVGLHSSP